MQFHLFPPPSPKPGTALESNPYRRAMSKPAVQATSIPLQALTKSPGTGSVVIEVKETAPSIKSLPGAHISPSKEAHLTTHAENGHATPQTLPTNPGVGERSSPSAKTPVSITVPSPVLVPAQNTVPGPRTVTSDTSEPPTTSVMPMRSMFPVFNPNRPLSQQSYYPQQERRIPHQWDRKEDYASHSRSTSHLDQSFGGIKTAPSSVLDFLGDDDATTPPTAISSPQELEALWQATNGHDSNEAPRSFDLRMSR